MTVPQKLQALLDNWRERWAIGGSPSAEMAMQCVLSLEHTLQAHPVVPLAELRAALKAAGTARIEALAALVYKYTPAPNPHPPGTYLWAREEHRLGRELTRHGWNGGSLVIGEAWGQRDFFDEDFTATDWEVVT